MENCEASLLLYFVEIQSNIFHISRILQTMFNILKDKYAASYYGFVMKDQSIGSMGWAIILNIHHACS